MPYKFIFNKDKNETFEAELHSMKCGHNDDINLKSCQKDVVIGLPYCWIHLIKRLSLRIKKGQYGKGIFAQNTMRFKKHMNLIIL